MRCTREFKMSLGVLPTESPRTKASFLEIPSSSSTKYDAFTIHEILDGLIIFYSSV